jgi:hypothetical protein
LNLKILGKKRQFWARISPKNGVFYVFRTRPRDPRLCRSCIRALENGPTGLKIGIHVPWDSYKKVTIHFSLYLPFFIFMVPKMHKKGHFWAKIGDFTKKSHFFHFPDPPKMQKITI